MPKLTHKYLIGQVLHRKYRDTLGNKKKEDLIIDHLSFNGKDVSYGGIILGGCRWHAEENELKKKWGVVREVPPRQ